MDSKIRSFQYKILNDVLYLNKKLFLFGKASSPLCSFSNLDDETILHLFYECNFTKELWNRLSLFFNDSLHLPHLSPQTACFGFPNTYSNCFLLENHILLLFKNYLYNSRTQGIITLSKFIRIIAKVKNIEKEIAGDNDQKIMLYNKKWLKIENMPHV